MIIKRKGGFIDKLTEVFMDDIELIVSAANIAGHLENAGKICIDSDAELTTWCVGLVEKYYRNSDSGQGDFSELAHAALMEAFGVGKI